MTLWLVRMQSLERCRSSHARQKSGIGKRRFDCRFWSNPDAETLERLQIAAEEIRYAARLVDMPTAELHTSPLPSWLDKRDDARSRCIRPRRRGARTCGIGWFVGRRQGGY